MYILSDCRQSRRIELIPFECDQLHICERVEQIEFIMFHFMCQSIKETATICITHLMCERMMYVYRLHV